MGELKWSSGLHRGCRELVISNGPHGVYGHKSTKGANEKMRMEKYTNDFTALEEVLVYTQFTDETNTAYSAALQTLNNLFSGDKGDLAMKSSFKYFGISCGCHKAEEEMCCVALSESVEEAEGV